MHLLLLPPVRRDVALQVEGQSGICTSHLVLMCHNRRGDANPRAGEDSSADTSRREELEQA